MDCLSDPLRNLAADGMQVLVVVLALALIVLSIWYIVRHKTERKSRIKISWVVFGLATIAVFALDLMNCIDMHDVAGYLELGIIALLLGAAVAETIFDL